MFKEKLFSYFCRMYDDHGVIPHEDEVYKKFQLHFDNGESFDVAEEEMQSFARIHDLNGVKIKWEGKLA